MAPTNALPEPCLAGHAACPSAIRCPAAAGRLPTSAPWPLGLQPGPGGERQGYGGSEAPLPACFLRLSPSLRGCPLPALP